MSGPFLYNYFRDCYDPQTGRYCQPDPLGLYGGDLSLYLYGRSNPLSHIDPMGLTPLAGAAGASGGATGGFGGLGGFGTNSGGRNRGDDGSFGGLFPPGTFPGNSPNAMSSWEDDLDFADNGPKTEWQPWRCKTDEDRDCRDRRIGLQIMYTKIKILGLLGANTAAAKSSYNSMVRAYHRDCPNWGKLPLMQ